MCGITGKIFFDRNHKIEEGLIHKMCQALVHRGPDSEGIYEDYNFGFGMRRLSIIDLVSGQQPIFNEDNTMAVVFNGEIYNYKELREELRAKGHQFKTDSDTEVIIHCYEEYGKEFVQKLNGMFAIAIWDAKNQRLLLARDRLGIKPLYYYQDQEKLIFASELKAVLEDQSVLRTVDLKSLDLYLSFMYIPAPFSMFENIRKLSPGHILSCEDGCVQLERYWDVEFHADEPQKSLEEYEEEFNFLLEDSVKRRMISDVPLGAFLSGGIDSSSIVAMMSQSSDRPIKTFSIGFKDGGYHDETYFSQMVADKFQTDHKVFHVDASVINLISDYVYHFDEPFADYAAFPTYVLAKLAREHVKVVLTGDGCDEIFAGYERYGSEQWAQQYKKIPSFVREKLLLPVISLGKKLSVKNESLYNLFNGADKKTRLMRLDDTQRYIQSRFNFTYVQKKSLFNNQNLVQHDFSSKVLNGYLQENDQLDFLSRRLYLDIKTSLAEDMLTKVDRMTMAVSLEARVPFLDHRLVEFSARLPSRFKMDLFSLKKFVKGALRDTLPGEIIRRPKHGFSSPIDQWFRTDLKTLVQDSLSNETIKRQNFFAADYVQDMINSHMESKANCGKELFMLMVFSMWHERFIK